MGRMMQHMLNKEATACFTGHRQLREPAAMIAARLTQTLEHLIQSGYRTFCAGGARGFDALASETVISMQAQYPQIRLESGRYRAASSLAGPGGPGHHHCPRIPLRRVLPAQQGAGGCLVRLHRLHDQGWQRHGVYGPVRPGAGGRRYQHC